MLGISLPIRDVKAVNDLLVAKNIDVPIHGRSHSSASLYTNPASRRCLGRLRRPVRQPRPPVGLPPAKGGQHQRVWTQVRTGMWQRISEQSDMTGLPRCWLDCLAKPRVPPAGADLQHQLPRRRPGLIHPQLLARSLADHRPVLPADPPGQEGLPLHHVVSVLPISFSSSDWPAT